LKKGWVLCSLFLKQLLTMKI